MILENLHMVNSDEPVNIRTTASEISAVSTAAITACKGEQSVSFTNAMVFPGLINSHDHLDFNLFPQLGDRHYNNYTEWGNDIHRKFKSEIDRVLVVPQTLRYKWGLFKNLLCGVTTVVNHGALSGLNNDLITVHEKSQSIHSVGFEKGWRFKLNNPVHRNQPVNIHIGEGNDQKSFNEINQLIAWNLLGRDLIGIHGVAMTEKQASKFKAMVWCPETNYFMLEKTAQVDLLQDHTKILFGTDSTLTADWDIWNHLRMARKTGMLSDDALYKTLNENAAEVWNLNTGKLEIGRDADIIVANAKAGLHGYKAFFAVRPADLLLVIHKGNIRLLDESLLPYLETRDTDGFSQIEIDGVIKYVRSDLPKLMNEINVFYPARFPVCTAKGFETIMT